MIRIIAVTFFGIHYGLRGMLERIDVLGGHLALHSGKEQGTTIEIDLPLITFPDPRLAIKGRLVDLCR
jgi:glucose-6-phosphate-specific signal transduction histidine kinase